MEHSWPELFILSGAQWGLLLEDSFLIGRTHFHVSNAKKLSDILNRIVSLNPDHTELACMKAVVLFKPGNSNRSNFYYNYKLFMCQNMQIHGYPVFTLLSSKKLAAYSRWTNFK